MYVYKTTCTYITVQDFSKDSSDEQVKSESVSLLLACVLSNNRFSQPILGFYERYLICYIIDYSSLSQSMPDL